MSTFITISVSWSIPDRVLCTVLYASYVIVFIIRDVATLAYDSHDPSLVLRSLLHHFLGRNALHSLAIWWVSSVFAGSLQDPCWSAGPSSPFSSLMTHPPLGVEASCCVVLVPLPFTLGELNVCFSVSVFLSIPMLKAVFPSVSVCSYCLACVFSIPRILQPVFSSWPNSACSISQLSAFGCCSPSCKHPSFDSQYL